MSSPLTFGVEFEFTIAWLPPSSEFQPPPGRNVHFEVDAEELRDAKMAGHLGERSRKHREKEVYQRAAIKHVSNTLKEAGFPVDADNTGALGDLTKWRVTNDFTIEGPKIPKNDPCPYEFLEIEVVSAAYYFTPAAVACIGRVVAVLSSKYLINVNESCGLHVHVGHGLDGYKLDHLKKIVSFIWSFEPQIETLHAPFRLNTNWARSMRDLSRLVNDHQQAHDKNIPTPLQGLNAIQQVSDIGDLVSLASDCQNHKQGAYNFGNLLAPDTSKSTIEFRQHKGTINGDEVTNWVNMVVGIVKYTEEAICYLFTDLLTIIEKENWSKTPGGQDTIDAENEANLGPIFADRDFTLVHLLEEIGLKKEALFYSTRLHKHYKKKLPRDERITNEQFVSWEYENWDPAERGADILDASQLRKIWESLHEAAEGLYDGTSSWFEPDDPMWPEHSLDVADEPSDVSDSVEEGTTESSESSSGSGSNSDGPSDNEPAGQLSAAGGSPSSPPPDDVDQEKNKSNEDSTKGTQSSEQADNVSTGSTQDMKNDNPFSFPLPDLNDDEDAESYEEFIKGMQSLEKADDSSKASTQSLGSTTSFPAYDPSQSHLKPPGLAISKSKSKSSSPDPTLPPLPSRTQSELDEEINDLDEQIVVDERAQAISDMKIADRDWRMTLMLGQGGFELAEGVMDPFDASVPRPAGWRRAEEPVSPRAFVIFG